jgi:amidophosphoribosyltransferase
MYQEAGAIFQTSTDSEILVHLLADPMFRARPQRVARALAELQGAFAFLVMTRNCVMAARDRHGFRPLSIGRRGDAWFFASETCALTLVGAEYVRDVEPGELVVIDDTGMHSRFFADSPPGEMAQCVFEMVYFARPDSRVFGKNIHLVRMEYGMKLAEEHPVEADIVVSIPDSGNSAALGFSRRSGIPLDYGFIRNHYVGRTFIMPAQGARDEGADLKIAVIPEVVKGKRVVVIDDSIVRGTTARRRVGMLRDAGATEVHVRVSCPPTAHPSFYGIDIPTPEELIASSKSVAEICSYLEADSLGYLSLEGLLSPFPSAQAFCCACFSGRYPVDPGSVRGKRQLESFASELPFD